VFSVPSVRNLFLRNTLVPFALVLLSCGPGKQKETVKDSTAVTSNKDEKVVRDRWPNGKTKSEAVYKNGMRNGVAKTFDKNGAIILELPYVNDIREGTSKKYYEGGKALAQTTEYKNDKMNGIQTKYRWNGDVMSEARYENDFPCAELREYLENKNLKKKYPHIEIKVEDRIKTTGVYKLKISLSDRVRSVKFYEGKLSASGCLSDRLNYLLLDEGTKTAEISWHLPPGSFVMEELNIIAAYETLMGNTAIAQHKYHVSIDN
jgi:hypothetical protein